MLAAAERGGLLNAPDIYMDKIVVGPSSRGAVDIDAPVAENLKNIARRLGRDVDDLTVICLDRAVTNSLIADVRATGARIRLISDGDLSAGISAAVAGTNIHALMGIGGAPEGVITAAAMKCLNGEIQAKLVFDPDKLGVDKSKVPPAEEVMERLNEMGISDPNKIYDTNDLAPGKKIIFAATGVTDGALLRGVRFFGVGQANAFGRDDDRLQEHPFCRHRPRRRRAGRGDPVLSPSKMSVSEQWETLGKTP